METRRRPSGSQRLPCPLTLLVQRLPCPLQGGEDVDSPHFHSRMIPEERFLGSARPVAQEVLCARGPLVDTDTHAHHHLHALGRHRQRGAFGDRPLQGARDPQRPEGPSRPSRRRQGGPRPRSGCSGLPGRRRGCRPGSQWRRVRQQPRPGPPRPRREVPSRAPRGRPEPGKVRKPSETAKVLQCQELGGHDRTDVRMVGRPWLQGRDQRGHRSGASRRGQGWGHRSGRARAETSQAWEGSRDQARSTPGPPRETRGPEGG